MGLVEAFEADAVAWRADAHAWDRAGALPDEVVKTLAQGGRLVPDLPREYGGAARTPRETGELCALLGGVCSSLRGLVTVQSMVAAALLRWGTDEQRASWLPALAAGEHIAGFAATEEGAGSDLRALTASVEPCAEGFRLRGRKLWVTFGARAGVFLVIARLSGRPVALLVEADRPGVTAERIRDPLGMRAAELADVRFDDVRVPAGHLVAPPGFGLSHVAATAIDHGRHTVAWGCVGLAESCLDRTAEHVATRVQGEVRLADHQLVRAVLGRARVAASAARHLCVHSAELRARKSSRAIAETIVAKYAAAEAAATVSQDAVQLHGAAGCAPDSTVGRFFRDAKIMQIIEGSRETAEVLIGDQTLRGRR